MKIERINDNRIRCTLASFDLSVRSINPVELAYGAKKAGKLFREMIQKVSNEVGSEAGGIPLMVEAVPLSSEDIMLVVTRIRGPEKLDTRFAEFSPFTEENQDSLLSQLTDEFLEDAKDSLSYLESDTVGEAQSKAGSASQGGKIAKRGTGAVGSHRTFRFDSLGHTNEVSRAMEGICADVNSLYKKPDTRQYYLIIKRQDCTDLDFSGACSVLAEYTAKLSNEGASGAYFKEHYEVMIRDQALQNLTKI